MKLLLTKQIKKLNSELVVPKKGAAEWKSNKPIFDKEALEQLLNWTISDYNVTYNGYTMAVVEMSVTPSKNIIGQVTLANGFHLFLAIDKIDEPTHIGLGGLETYDIGWGPLGLHCNTLSEDQQIVTALIPPNLNALVRYQLNPEQIELIKDLCPVTWLDRTNSIFCIKIQSLCNPNALHLFEKLGIDADTKIVYNHDSEIVKDEFSYYTFGDLLNCVSLWMRAALIRSSKFRTTPGPASDFEGDNLAWIEKIPFDHTKSPLKERTFSRQPAVKPVISDLPKFEDLPRDAEGNIADVLFTESTPTHCSISDQAFEACTSVAQHHSQLQTELWLKSNELVGSMGFRSQTFGRAKIGSGDTMAHQYAENLWCRFAEITGLNDKVNNPDKEILESFNIWVLELIRPLLGSDSLTSTCRKLEAATNTQGNISDMYRSRTFPVNLIENLVDTQEYCNPSFALVKVKNGQVSTDNADMNGDELRLEDGDYYMRKLDSEKVVKFKESLSKYKGVFRPKNQSTQVIKVDRGVIVSDSLNQLVGLKVDLESGTWNRHPLNSSEWVKQ